MLQPALCFRLSKGHKPSKLWEEQSKQRSSATGTETTQNHRGQWPSSRAGLQDAMADGPLCNSGFKKKIWRATLGKWSSP